MQRFPDIYLHIFLFSCLSTLFSATEIQRAKETLGYEKVNDAISTYKLIFVTVLLL